MAEFLGPVGLALGLLTRVAALGIAAIMLVAIFAVHRQHGFPISSLWASLSPSSSAAPVPGRWTH